MTQTATKQTVRQFAECQGYKVTTFTGADLVAEPEVDGDGFFIDAAITVTEFVDSPVELNERGLRPTSTSRATSSATNAPHAAEPASQYVLIS